jgi:outer membrane protein assembly factor BamB
MTLRIRCGLAAALLALCAPAGADEPAASWPQFRGPQGQGRASGPVPRRWSETEGVVWKTNLPGLGHSSPVHDGRRIWLTAAPRDGKALQALAIDAATGELLVEATVFTPDKIEPIHQDNSYASPTPVLGAGRLLVHFGTYGAAALHSQTGEVLWKNNELQILHDGGPGSSPVLFEDLLIVTLDGADQQLVAALDAASGRVRWRRDRSAPMPEQKHTHRAFATPLLIEFEGRPMLISPGANQCHAYDPRTGEELWHVRYTGFSNIARPVADETHCFICTGFFEPQLWAVNLAGEGNVTDSHVRWRYKGPAPDTPSPLLADGAIYLLSNKGLLSAVDTQTGKRNWVLRVGGNHSASPLYAQGLIYACGEDGAVKVIDPAGGKPKIVETNQLDGRIMASPAVIDGDLLIRTERSLYRIRGM